MASGKSLKRIRQSQLDEAQVKLAVPALFSFIEKTAKKDKQLFKDDSAFWILMSLKKVPVASKKPKLIPIPNVFNSGDEVCLFSKLPGKQVKEMLKSKGVTNVTKVISLSKLRKNHKTFQQKRALSGLYGSFLCDDRIFHLLPKALGKTFYSKKKEPTPVDLTKMDVKLEIDEALSSTKLRLGNGTCSAIKVGHAGQTQEEVVENVVAVASFIAKIVPRGWNNIQSIHVKTAESVALPLYNSLPDVETVVKKDKENNGDNENKEAEEEPAVNKEEPPAEPPKKKKKKVVNKEEPAVEPPKKKKKKVVNKEEPAVEPPKKKTKKI